MSLTSLLKDKTVREMFSNEFSMPVFDLKGDLIAQPQTNNYMLVGTAFDYLMRFVLKRINRHAITQEWVAEGAVEVVDKRWLLRKIKEILAKAKKVYLEYVKTGVMNKDVLETCLLLAQLDQIYRSGFVIHKIGIIDSRDIEDLKNLFNLLEKSNFIANKICMLNPTFGEASLLVDGADMDLLIGNTLIDIKTTKYLELKRDYVNQLIGYYLLYQIGGIDDAPAGINIEFVGIYYSRHGLLYKTPIKDITKNCDMDKIIKRFKQIAKHTFSFQAQY